MRKYSSATVTASTPVLDIYQSNVAAVPEDPFASWSMVDRLTLYGFAAEIVQDSASSRLAIRWEQEGQRVVLVAQQPGTGATELTRAELIRIAEGLRAPTPRPLDAAGGAPPENLATIARALRPKSAPDLMAGPNPKIWR